MVTELSALPNYYCLISLYEHNEHNIAARRELVCALGFSDEILSFMVDRSIAWSEFRNARQLSLASPLGISKKEI
jgi:hypothetical protein